jgi:hypothetical protein
LAFNAISYNSASSNCENETVKHRCHAAPRHRRSWKLKKATEDFCIRKTVRMIFSVVVDFIVIAVESKIGLFLF